MVGSEEVSGEISVGLRYGGLGNDLMALAVFGSWARCESKAGKAFGIATTAAGEERVVSRRSASQSATR